MISRCDGIGRRRGLKMYCVSHCPDRRKPLCIKDFDNLIGRCFSNVPPKCPSDFQRAIFERVFEKQICRCDGIGRRAGFKIQWWQHRVGSTPTTGTKKCPYGQ